VPGAVLDLSERDRGVILGLLIAQGSFGGDARQPQVTLRMHVRHERLLRWLADRVPGSRLYGPYHHGGRSYFQWMVRGEALARELLPVLDPATVAELDDYAAERLGTMTERYGAQISRAHRDA
jgi:hypothetical protein